MSLKGLVTLDLEWNANLDDEPLLVLGIGGSSYPYHAIPPGAFDKLIDPSIGKIVFTKADHHWLIEHGVEIGGPIVDVQVMCYVYDETTPLTLDWCSKNYLNIDPDKRIVRQKGIVYFRCDDGKLVPIGQAPMDQLRRYNRRDLSMTEDLYFEMYRRLEAAGSLAYWKDMHEPFSKVLLDMELNGLPISMNMTDKLRLDYSILASGLEKDLRYGAKLPEQFNLNSRDQIANQLFSKEYKLPAKIRLDKYDMENLKEGVWPDVIDTRFDIQKVGRELVHGEFELKGFGFKPRVKAPKCAAKKCDHPAGKCIPSVSSKTLKIHHSRQDPWIGDLIKYREYDKALQFLAVWVKHQKDGRLHTHFNQTGTATGRLSSSDPVNLQNVPSRGSLGKEIRSLFRPKDNNVFVNGDFSQIEPRLMAHFSGDPMMRKVFKEGKDIYEETTMEVLGKYYSKGTPERQLVRTCFLAMGYGARPPKIKDNLAEEGFYFSIREVERSYKAITEMYEVFWNWKDEEVARGRELGYVETIAGHRRHLNFKGENGWKAERQCVNSKIQGSAANITQKTMILAHEEFPKWNLILQVHDEIMFEADRDDVQWTHLKTFKYLAEFGHGFALNVPIVFDPIIAKSWREAK